MAVVSLENNDSPKEWSLIYLNVQSLSNKINFIDILTEEVKPHFLCFTEHWYTNDIELNSVYLHGYKSISNFCRKRAIHGGSVIYARVDITEKCKEVTFLKNISREQCIECSAVSVDKDICIITIYRPPNQNNFDNFLINLEHIFNFVTNNFKYTILCGDLNIDKLANTTCSKKLQDLICSFQLKCLVNEPTRIATNSSNVITATAIDYLVSNIKNYNLEVQNLGVSDHSALFFKWETPISGKACLSTVHQRQKRIVNNNTINEFITLFNRESLDIIIHDNTDRNVDIDEIFEQFYSNFDWCFKLSHPIRTPKNKPSDKKNAFNLSDELKNQSRQLRELNWYRKNTNDNTVHENYKNLKKQLSKNIDLEKKLYYNSIINDAENKTKKLWELVNLKLNRKNIHTNKINIRINDDLIMDTCDIVNHFGKYFANSVAEQVQIMFSDSSVECTLPFRNNSTMFFRPFIDEDIQKIIAQLKNKPSVGFDEVPTRLIKECSKELSPYITNIINKSVISGKFPNKLKVAKTTPIFKKGDPELIENYRAIVTLSPFSKIIEKAIYIRLTEFLLKHNQISKCQHGFRNGYSTETATTELTQYILGSIDKGETVIGVFFDLSRAFDTLNSAFLSQKLDYLGIRGNINDWIISYTTNRQLVVKIEHTISELYDVELGTPQGSVLGPLLFILYINDLPNYIHEGKVIMYADDTTILVSGKTKEEITYKIEQVTRQFNKWCTANHLINNSNKTVYIEFTGLYRTSLGPFINDDNSSSEIKLNKSTKFLGTFVDSSVSWSEQIDHICSKLNKSFFALKTLKNTLNENSLLNFYYACVYSTLSYNIISWGQTIEYSRVFTIQKRIIRLIFGMTQRESCRTIFIDKKILTLACIYILKLLVYIHHNINNYKKHTNIHMYPTRNKNNIYVEKFGHTYYKKSPYYAGQKYYNLLPPEIKNSRSVNIFKAKIKKLLLEKCFYSLKEFEEYCNSVRHY